MLDRAREFICDCLIGLALLVAPHTERGDTLVNYLKAFLHHWHGDDEYKRLMDATAAQNQSKAARYQRKHASRS